MATYRFLAVDTCTDAIITELPLAGVTYSRRLNGAGTLSAVCPLTADDLTLSGIWVDGTEPTRRGVYVERDGVIVWGGIWWARDTTDSHTLQVSGGEWWSVLRRRHITDTLVYVAGVDDQLDIARALVDYTQAKPGGDLLIDTGSGSSGRTRDRTYWGYEAKQVADAIEELAAVEDGFDFSLDCVWSAGVPARQFVVSYPRRGRSAVSSGLVFSSGRNIIDWDWPEDGSRAANCVHGVGAGEGDSMLRSSVTRTDRLDAGYPLLEEVLSLKDVSVQSTLAAHVVDRVAAYASPVTLPRIRVIGDQDPVVGSYICGDEVRIVLDPCPRFPDGVDTYRRIVAYDVSVSETTAETVELVTAEALV